MPSDSNSGKLSGVHTLTESLSQATDHPQQTLQFPPISALYTVLRKPILFPKLNLLPST